MTTSAPVVYFMLRGHILWPIRKPIRFDIIPVDHVVLGLLHVAAAMFQGPVAPVFQLGTSDLPGHLTFGASCAYVSESRRKNKSRRDYGLPVWNWIRTRLPVLHVLLWTYRAFSAPLLIRLLAILPIPGRQDLKKAVYNLHRTIMAYLPFFHDHDFWFVTGNIRKLSPLPEINWREYWIEIHVKGLMKWVFADLAARPERIRGIRSLVRKVLYRLQAWVYRRGFGFDVYGADNIPAGGRVIIAANHASHLDMGLVKQSLGRFGYRMLSLAAEDYFFGSVMKRFYFKNFTTLLPMGRTTNIKTSLKLASDRLRRGYPVLIFPEGTRSADGQIRDFKPSLGYLALRNKAGILPVRLDGTFAAWPKGKVLPRFTRLRATVGPLIRHDRILGMTEGMSHRDAYRVISAETERVVRSLNPDSATLSLNSDSSPDQTRP
jgi:1-acyl-sn-glycerol-3-phosphate acyltransferase